MLNLRIRSNPTLLFITAFLLLAATPSPTHSFSFSSLSLYRNLFSNAHSLLSAVADLRDARGDVAGAARARALASKVEGGLGFGFGLLKMVWSAGWDFAWRLREFSVAEFYGDMNELLRELTEFTRLESSSERAAWVSGNYQNLLNLFKSFSSKLLKSFGSNTGLVREVVETVQKEVVEGGLIRDCLELGGTGNDLKAFIQVVKDLVFKFSPVSETDQDQDQDDDHEL